MKYPKEGDLIVVFKTLREFKNGRMYIDTFSHADRRGIWTSDARWHYDFMIHLEDFNKDDMSENENHIMTVNWNGELVEYKMHEPLKTGDFIVASHNLLEMMEGYAMTTKFIGTNKNFIVTGVEGNDYQPCYTYCMPLSKFDPTNPGSMTNEAYKSVDGVLTRIYMK